MDLTKRPGSGFPIRIQKKSQKKLDKGVLFLIIHLLVIVSVPFSISDLPPENRVREDPFHSKGENALRFSWNMTPQGG